jgi:hypothetical protein
MLLREDDSKDVMKRVATIQISGWKFKKKKKLFFFFIHSLALLREKQRR